MSLRTLLVTLTLCLLPISELRGGLPFALSNGVPLPVAYLICVGANVHGGFIRLAPIYATAEQNTVCLIGKQL